jgi:hypothetical protein
VADRVAERWIALGLGHHATGGVQGHHPGHAGTRGRGGLTNAAQRDGWSWPNARTVSGGRPAMEIRMAVTFSATTPDTSPTCGFG